VLYALQFLLYAFFLPYRHRRPRRFRCGCRSCSHQTGGCCGQHMTRRPCAPVGGL